MSSILKGIKQLNEVNPNNYDSDWDYQNAVANSGRSRSRSSDSYDAHDAENDAYEMHKRFAATRARKEAEAKAAAEKLDELSPQTLASYKKKAGADATASDKAGNYKRGDKRMSGIMQATKKEFANDAKGVAETTGDKPFDKIMTTIKQGTNKQKTADRKEQQKQTQQQARDAFGNMFGGGNPADKLKIREQGVAEEKPGLWANIHAKQERIKHGSGERMRKPGSKGAPTADALRKSAVKESSILEGLQQVDEINWKHAAAAGAMALGALGSGHAQAADLSGYNTQYLQRVAQGNHPRPMVNVADAKAELQARMSANPVSGKTPEEAMSDPRYKSDPIFKAEVDRAASIGSAPKSQSSNGFSMEYLQKAADPNRFGRYLVSVEKAQELLNQARSR
jgi:hypothetical protein